MSSDVGELTLECQLCGASFTYVKTTGPRRMYCSERCKANAGDIMRKAAHAHRLQPQAPVESLSRSAGTPTHARSIALYSKACIPVYRLWQHHGLSGGSFDELLTAQSGHCAICATEDAGPKGWHIDHDHACCPGIGSCGACVRELLCHRCNLMLGNARDKIETLERAVKYLRATSQFSMPVRLVK